MAGVGYNVDSISSDILVYMETTKSYQTSNTNWRQKIVPSLAIYLAALGIGLVDAILKYSFVESGVGNVGVFLGLNLGTAAIWHIMTIILVLILQVRMPKVLRIGINSIAILSLSNLLDRVVRGSVLDYWSIGGIWFNLSDLAIVIVLIGIIYIEIKHAYEKRG
jgi:hypothetical protein